MPYNEGDPQNGKLLTETIKILKIFLRWLLAATAGISFIVWANSLSNTLKINQAVLERIEDKLAALEVKPRFQMGVSCPDWTYFGYDKKDRLSSIQCKKEEKTK